MNSKELAWMLMGGISAAVAGGLSRQAVKQGWRTVARDEPPTNPAASDVTWRQALLWAVATGALVGMARVAARRGAAAGWRKYTGRRPPGL